MIILIIKFVFNKSERMMVEEETERFVRECYHRFSCLSLGGLSNPIPALDFLGPFDLKLLQLVTLSPLDPWDRRRGGGGGKKETGEEEEEEEGSRPTVASILFLSLLVRFSPQPPPSLSSCK